MKKEHTVIPVRVVEKILRRTLEGESISHIVELPTPSQNQVDLDKLGPGIYSSSAAAMSVMIENASNTISDIIKKAENIAQTVFNAEIVISPSTEHTSEVTTNSHDSHDHDMNYQVEQPNIEFGNNIEIDLGNGVKGKVNMSGLET
tara:strand:- start:1696 stop:2133 length:438 start_codon:yes stop_codon:yes gene_type:complete